MTIDNKLITDPNEKADLSIQTDKPRSVLTVIKEQLIGNPDVYVAPIQPIFDANELNAFMQGIISIKPSSTHLAAQQSDGYLRLGKLYYDEVIGSIRKIVIEQVETTEPEIIQKVGGIVGETRTESTKAPQRRTAVKVYPERFSAQEVHDYQAGLARGAITRPMVGNMTDHWLEPDQIERLKALHHKEPPAPIKGLLE